MAYLQAVWVFHGSRHVALMIQQIFTQGVKATNQPGCMYMYIVPGDQLVLMLVYYNLCGIWHMFQIAYNQKNASVCKTTTP